MDSICKAATWVYSLDLYEALQNVFWQEDISEGGGNLRSSNLPILPPDGYGFAISQSVVSVLPSSYRENRSFFFLIMRFLFWEVEGRELYPPLSSTLVSGVTTCFCVMGSRGGRGLFLYPLSVFLPILWVPSPSGDDRSNLLLLSLSE